MCRRVGLAGWSVVIVCTRLIYSELPQIVRVAPIGGGNVGAWCDQSCKCFTLGRDRQEFRPMTRIELPDQEVAALKAKAAAEGLTLEAWLKKLANEEASSTAPRSPKEAAARILELQKRVKPDPEGWTVHDYINRDR